MDIKMSADHPMWMDVAIAYTGQREIKGPSTAAFISKFLQRLRSAWKDDEVAWCGTFIAGVLDETNIKANRTGYMTLRWPKHWYRALAYADPSYGTHLSPAQYRAGAICVKTRIGGGHVFFYMAESATHIFGIGGNTQDSVKGAWYPKRDIVAVVWPQGSIMSDPDRDKRNFVRMDGAPVVNRED